MNHRPRRVHRSPTRQHGYVLLPVMLAVALVAAVALMMNHEGVTNLRLLDNDLEGARAEYVAQAGIQHALWRAGQQGCGPYTDLSNEPLGGDTYTTGLTNDLGSTTRYTVAVDQDTWIRLGNPGQTNGDDDKLQVSQSGGDFERALIRYDLSAIPADAPILSATAWYFVQEVHPEGSLNLHRLTANWIEAEASWDNMGDYIDSAVLASIPPQSEAGVWVKVNLTSQVQAWVNGQPNHGIALDPAVEGVSTKYAGRKGVASEQPYLQVVVGTPPSSPTALKSVGTLGNGVSRSLTRDDVTLYQQPANVVYLQPDAAAGRDGYVYEWKPTWNYGRSGEIWAENRYAYSRANGLLHFDLSVVPYGARVTAAVLELYQTNASLSGGPIAVRRMESAWVEGDQDGGLGAPNWTLRDAAQTWATAGGDYAVDPAATTTVAPGQGWASWDIADLVEGWVSGAVENHGLALVAGSFGTAAHFASSDATDPTLRPKLTITYTCACGSPCVAPRGKGTVLMVVINPTTLVAEDAGKKALFESWGYAVTIVGESANQAAYDAALATADVVFVSETVNSTQVGNKLKDATIGVVSQDGTYNAALGFASGSAWPVGAEIDVTDTGHYITAMFRPGPLKIYSAGMEQLTVAGVEAAGLQILAQSGAAGALVVLDKGAATSDGGSAAGRRVMLPLGRDNTLNWNRLTAEGRLVVQRALAWGMGADAAGPPRNLLFVSGGTTVTEFPSGDLVVIPTAQEQARIELMTSWGYTVNLIADDDSQANFDGAVAANDVAYVSSQATELALGTKLKGATIGVVNERHELVDEFGFGQQGSVFKSRTEIDVVDNGHYITEPFSTGLLTLLTSNQTLNLMTATTAPGFVALGRAFNTGSLWDDVLGVIGTGAELHGGGNAAGRRVLLPWGDAAFDVAALNADGLTIMRRAIEWAEGAGSDPEPGFGVLLVVADPGALSTQEAAKKALIESWGFTVAVIDDGDTQTNYDAALAGVDAVYVTEQIIAGELGTKLKAATVGIVNEDPELHSVFGFSTVRQLATDNAPLTTDDTHYITSPFGGLEVTLFTADQPMGAAVGTLASGLDTVGAWAGGALAPLGGLLAMEAGAAIAGGGSAAGRRVQTPWGGQDGVSVTDIGALSADGLTMLRRAIEWAAGADAGGGGGEPSCAATVADDFESGGYGGSTGTLPWAGDWLEVFESDGPGAGDEKVLSFGGDLVALVKDRGQGGSGEGLEREADLSGHATATLTYTYWRVLGNNDRVTVQVSTDGGASWTDLTAYIGAAADNEASPQSASFDISPFIGADTRIRFMTGSSNSNGDGLYFDDVKICLGN